MTIRDHVILSKAKDLKVCVTVDGPTDCEMLRYAQHDMERQNDERTKRLNDNVAVNPVITVNTVNTVTPSPPHFAGYIFVTRKQRA